MGTSYPNDHAPIGVMGDHTHKMGELMLSYRFMHMAMRGNSDGSRSLTPEQIAGMPGLRVVPTEMSTDVHMLGFMYAPGDRITLMGMGSYVEKKMNHITFMGMNGTTRLGTFTTRSSGFGDTSLSALVLLKDAQRHRWHTTLGVSLPTGDIEETGVVLTPMGANVSLRLPYPMQLGSGGYDAITGLTYSGDLGVWDWGSQWRSVFRFDKNDQGYTLGDEHRATAWLSHHFGHYISASARLAYYHRGNISGTDALINAPVQTADPGRQGARRWDISFGVNFIVPGHKHRLALEAGIPLSQELDGPQLESDWRLLVGWQYSM